MIKTHLPKILSASIIALSLAGCTNAAQDQATQAAATSAATSAAQSTASQLTSGLTGALGLPNLSGTPVSNLTGALQYCTTNNLATSSTASSVLANAAQKPDVTTDPAYRAGQQGILQAVSNQTNTQQQYSLSSLAEPLRKKVCSAITSRLQHML